MSSKEGRPKTLLDLCDYCNLSLDILHVICVFCSKVLSTAEVYAFQYKDLNVAWRNNLPYGACALCLEVYGEIRYRRHREYSYYGKSVEEECGKPLEQLYIRCLLCHKPLCDVEKQRHVTHNKHFHKVAGEWRGRCLQCWKPSCTERRRRSRR
ncbi:E6 [Macaca mulatta papillomavirus 2]|uniref:Protein E6 n=1 Tax=Macaca mulatta papillomavirus 2 TaxID=2294150 RepID=A0A385AHQ9_9PAPI|nr:E6 [Macaca mulatta papillomavirus 2]AXN57280.1 E6 [Macaca mulatta papillomavirus 2]